jgi:hypothetical protein
MSATLRRQTRKRQDRRKKSGNLAGQHRRTWKTCHAGPLWIRSASFSARLSEAPWPRNSSHSCYSS